MKTFLRMTSAIVLLAILTGCRLFTDTATLVVENQSGFFIDEVYLSQPGASEWGDDLCSDTIPPGESQRFPGLTPGTYDILVWDTDEGWDIWLGEVLEPWVEHTISYQQ